LADQEIYLHPELRNLASDFDEEELKELGAEVVKDFKTDIESRSEWMRMRAEWVRQYYQKDKPINPPWEGASEESIPILAEASVQFTARAHKAMFSGRTFIQAIPTGKTDAKARARADRIKEHITFQLLDRDKNYKRHKKRLLTSLSRDGSMFTKTYHDPLKGRNVVENVRAVDIAVPYGVGPRDVEDLSRWSHYIRLTKVRADQLTAKKYFDGEVELHQGGQEWEVDEAHDEAHGLQPPSADDQQICVLIEQHRWWDFGDGMKPYIVTVDYQSSEVKRVSIRWETDERGDPIADFEPTNCLTHYVFMENPDGFYGLGQGHLLSEINKSVNKLLRQTVDAGTLANVGNNSGFISEQIAGPSGGDVQFSLGKFKKVSGTAEDMARGIYQFKFPGANNVGPQAIELLMMRGDRLSNATEAITGQTNSVMQPTTVMALIEQGLEVFSSVYETIIECWSDELMLIYKLNHKHMDPEEYFSVFDIMGQLKEITVTREDYAPDFQVKPIADPKRATPQQKMQRAQLELQTSLQNPLVLNSPQHIYNAYRRFFESIDTEAIDEILPNPAANLPQIDDPMQENMLASSGTPMMPMAFTGQDHISHIQAHQAAIDEKSLSALGQAIVEEHITSHKRLLNAESAGEGLAVGPGNSMGSQGGASGQVPPGGMENGVLGGETSEISGSGSGEGFLGESSGPGGLF